MLLHPLITEKASALGSQRKYVFLVGAKENKIEVAKEVERLYKVNVEKVTTIRVKPKVRRLGRFLGAKPGFKKAVLTLGKGQKIEV